MAKSRREALYGDKEDTEETKPATAEQAAEDIEKPGGTSARHKAERVAMRERHEKARMALHGSHRDEHRALGEAHEAEHDEEGADVTALHRKHEHAELEMLSRHMRGRGDLAATQHGERHAMHSKHEMEQLQEHARGEAAVAGDTPPGEGGAAQPERMRREPEGA